MIAEVWTVSGVGGGGMVGGWVGFEWVSCEWVSGVGGEFEFWW